MNRTILTATLGVGGVLAAGALVGGAGLVSAQTADTDEAPPTTEAPAPDPDPDGDTPWGDGESPWGDGDTPWGDGESPWGDGEFRGGPMGRGGFGGFGGGGLDHLAEDLGLTTDELDAAFEAGQTLPEIAEAQGIDLDQLFADRADEARDRLDEAVASGDISQEHADRISERMDGVADGEFPWGDGEFRGGPMGRGGFGGGLDHLAEDLGMTTDELDAAFEAGQTLPEIAEAQGIDLGDVVGGRFDGEGSPWGGGTPPWADEEAS